MTTPIDALHILSSGLDATLRRHQVIASNIANAQAKGYTPLKATFELRQASAFEQSFSALQGAPSASWSPGSDTLVQPQVALRIEEDLDNQGVAKAVRLDEQMGLLAENGAHYQALVKAMNRQLSLLSLAASEGRK